jgi:hypothetical protein
MLRCFSLLIFPMILFCEGDTKPNGCKGVSLCHSYRAQEGAGFFVYGGVIAANARLTGALYAHTVDGFAADPYHEANVLRPDFKLNVGFDGGIGYRYFHDNWSCNLNFFHIRSTTECCNCVCDDYIGYVPDCVWCHDLFSTTNHIDPLDSFLPPVICFEIIHSDLDLLLERATFLSGQYSFTAGFGLKNTWLEFCDNTHYCDVYGYYNCCAPVQLRGDLALILHDIKRCDRTDFYGIGPLVDFNSKACLTDSFAFFNEFDVALLVGHSKTCNKLYVDQVCTVTMNDSFSTLSPYIGVKLGVEFTSCHRNNTLQFVSRLSFDNAVYFNQYNRICYDGICKLKENQNNTYCLTGLAFNLGLEF